MSLPWEDFSKTNALPWEDFARGPVQKVNETDWRDNLPQLRAAPPPTLLQRIQDTRIGRAILGPQVQPPMGMVQGALPQIQQLLTGGVRRPSGIPFGSTGPQGQPVGLLNINPSLLFNKPEGAAVVPYKILEQINPQNIALGGALGKLAMLKDATTAQNIAKAAIATKLMQEGAEQAGEAGGKLSVSGWPITLGPDIPPTGRVGGPTPQRGQTEQWENLTDLVLSLLQVGGGFGTAAYRPTETRVGPLADNKYVSGEIQQGTREMPFQMPDAPRRVFYMPPPEVKGSPDIPIVGQQPRAVPAPVITPEMLQQIGGRVTPEFAKPRLPIQETYHQENIPQKVPSLVPGFEQTAEHKLAFREEQRFGGMPIDPEDLKNLPKLIPGERLIFVRRQDGSMYPASFGDKYWNLPDGTRVASIGKPTPSGWSHTMLGEGEEIVRGRQVQGGENAIRELRPGGMAQTQPTGYLPPVGEIIRPGAKEEGVAQAPKGQEERQVIQSGTQETQGQTERVLGEEGGAPQERYSGAPLPDFTHEAIKVLERLFPTPYVKASQEQMLGTLRNKLGEGSAEWRMWKDLGIEKVQAKTPGELDKWMKDNGPRVEVRKFGDELSQTREMRDRAQMIHQAETLGFRPIVAPNRVEIDSFTDLIGNDLRYDDATPAQQRLMDDIIQRGYQADARVGEGGSHWQSIAPKSEQDMPGYVEIAVTKPLPEPPKRYKVGYNPAERGEQFPSTHSFPPNTLGFVRGYMETTPKGEKVFHVIEVQSDWAQQARTARERGYGRVDDEGIPYNEEFARRGVGREVVQDPLLQHYERLALKAAIDHARQEGATKVAVSDMPTVAMTEGHDRVIKEMENYVGAVNSRRKAIPADLEHLENYYGKHGAKFHVEDGKIVIDKRPFEEGDRLHYDQTLPRILSELTGDKGEKVSFGEHRMAYDFREGLRQRQAEDWRNPEHYKDPVRKDLIFRNPSGEPKTDVSAKVFDISKFSERRAAGEPMTMMGKRYAGVPVFDPELWGMSKEQVEAAKEKFSKVLIARGDKQAAEAQRTASPRQFIPKTEREKAILNNPNAKRFDKYQEQVAQPGEKLPISDKFKNFLGSAMNAANRLDKILNPADVMYDWLDGGRGRYNGPLMENIRKPLDADFNDELNLRRSLIDPISDLIKKNKMGKRESGRIGVYLNSLQEGGTKRMIQSGIQEGVINNILRTISPAEKEVAAAIRELYDRTGPLIQKVAKDVDKIDVKLIPNYFSWQREWRKYKQKPDELATDPTIPKSNATVDDVLWPGLPDSLGGRVIPGSTISRKPRAKSPIKVDAFEIVDRYVRDASHYIVMRKHLKEISATVRKDEFARVYGEMGQELVMDHLNTIARQGRYKRNAFLDAIRRLTSRGVIAFRIPSQVVHMANIPLAQQRTGVVWWHKGLDEALSEDGQAFLHKHFAETFERGGGEPALREVAEGQMGRQSLPVKFGKAGFWLQRRIDQLNAQATVLGLYMKSLAEQGKDPTLYHELPVDTKAVNDARVLSRRAVASPLYKDIPGVIPLGGSITRSLFQFQNTFLDQYSNIRYDLIQAGIPEAIAGRPRLAMEITAAVGAMLLVETAIKYGYSQALAKATGSKTREDETYLKKLEHEALRRIPGMGQLQAQLIYGETGIPSVDVALDPVRQAVRFGKATDKAGKTMAATRAGFSALEMAGIPGASQASDIVQGLERSTFFKSHEKKLEEQTGKTPSAMPLRERILAEQTLKKSLPPQSKEEQAKMAERSIANIHKRGEEVAKQMSKADRVWMESRGLEAPGYDNKLRLGGTMVYLSEEETKRLGELVKEQYNTAIARLRVNKRFDSLSTTERKSVFDATMLSARTAAHALMTKEINEKSRSENEPNPAKRRRFKL